MNQEIPLVKRIYRILRAPLFLGSLLITSLVALFILAVVSIGSWFEKVLRWLGYRSRPSWLPPFLGVLGYMGLGLAGPGGRQRCLAEACGTGKDGQDERDPCPAARLRDGRR